ncbi:hypothetical protein F2Q69_00056963 [Brassica cretica]|uniref:Uncharacterized protein n=1 Tax=Brassica cretica TaxID=69181 RepID=A0A8S9N3G2_BRACR|nr:hypothetical protein F2Q69_00056963 [Brassica cretica]
MHACRRRRFSSRVKLPHFAAFRPSCSPSIYAQGFGLGFGSSECSLHRRCDSGGFSAFSGTLGRPWRAIAVGVLG